MVKSRSEVSPPGRAEHAEDKCCQTDGEIKTPSDLKVAAQYYADRGLPVFPVKPRDKCPLGRIVPHGLKEATTDHEQIARWWRSEPRANVAILTGIAFDVLDVDRAGWPSLAHLVELHEPLEIGPVALTPGGGSHYLFRPTGLDKPSEQLRPLAELEQRRAALRESSIDVPAVKV